VKPGDRVETPDGPGLLLAWVPLVIRDEHGRPRDETGTCVEFPDGHRQEFMPGLVHPSHERTP